MSEHDLYIITSLFSHYKGLSLTRGVDMKTCLFYVK